MRYVFLLIGCVVTGYVVACRNQPRLNQPSVYRNHPLLLEALGIVPFLAVLFASIRAGWATVGEAVAIYVVLGGVVYVVCMNTIVRGPHC